MVELLVAVAYVVQYGACLLFCGCFHQYLLEAAFKGTILLYAVTIFVKRCSTYTLELASCQGGFHYIGGIHGSWRTSGAYYGVDLVDEDNDVRILLNLAKEGLYALLELSAILCSCHNARHVKTHDALAKENGRCALMGDQLCQSFHDGTLAYARVANEYGVVLLASAQDLRHAHDLPLASHHGVEQPVGSSLCEVGREAVEHGCGRVDSAVLRRCGCRVLSGL